MKDRQNLRRGFLAKSAAGLGAALLGIMPFTRAAQAQTWQKINSNSGVTGKWRKLNYVPQGSGIVKAWGENAGGSLGNNSIANACLPVNVCNITNAVSVAAGFVHGMALLSDGRVMSWGQNDSNQLGDGTNVNRSTPVFVCGISTAVAIASAGITSFALLSDGTVKGWGGNGNGTIGDNTTCSKSIPVTLTNLTNAVAISARDAGALALISDGTVKRWGYGSFICPTTVTEFSNAIAIGGHHSAVTVDGRVWRWGPNDSGELGNNTVGTTDFTSPVAVCGISNAIAAVPGCGSAFALLANGTIKVWGCAYLGRMGNNVTTGVFSTPVTVCGISTAVMVSARNHAAHALLQDGTIRSWGSSYCGSLGNGTTTNTSIPVSVCGVSVATVIASQGDLVVVLS